MMSVVHCLIGSTGFLTAVWVGASAIGQPDPEPADEGTPPAATQPADTAEPPEAEPDTGSPSMPTAEDVIQAFERERPPNEPIPPSTTSAPSGGKTARPGFDSGPRARLPDGFLLIDRTGRLVRDGQWWTFAFEADSDSLAEPPMRLLPNRMLERMVFEAQGAGEGFVFLVSGEVTEFQGDNYLLLRKLLRRRDYGNLEQ